MIRGFGKYGFHIVKIWRFLIRKRVKIVKLGINKDARLPRSLRKLRSISCSVPFVSRTRDFTLGDPDVILLPVSVLSWQTSLSARRRCRCLSLDLRKKSRFLWNNIFTLARYRSSPRRKVFLLLFAPLLSLSVTLFRGQWRLTFRFQSDTFDNFLSKYFSPVGPRYGGIILTFLRYLRFCV